MKNVVIALMAGIVFLGAPVFAEDSPNLFKPENRCNIPGAWEGWERLVRKYPDDMSLQALHALRIGLCVKIEQGTVSLNNAIKIFDDAHNLVIQKVRSEHEKDAPSL